MNENEKMNESIISALKAFEYNLSQIDDLLKNGYREVSIILIVSAFESFLGDIFELCSDQWFNYKLENERVESRKIIYEYLDKINILDEFIKRRYLYSNSDHYDSGYGQLNTYIADEKTLFDILLGKNGKGKINFQNLKNEYGVKIAYKKFFNIDLDKSLDKDSATSNKLWEKLIKLFDERHAIVHKGKRTAFSEKDIDEVLNSIKFLKKQLCGEIISKTLKRHEGSYEC